MNRKRGEGPSLKGGKEGWDRTDCGTARGISVSPRNGIMRTKKTTIGSNSLFKKLLVPYLLPAQIEVNRLDRTYETHLWLSSR
ncbi:hypothetical protein KY289_017833 [Solanum tuberosum]|nr:hypothetical protein KY289_017833 [Solanum tuberosum]